MGRIGPQRHKKQIKKTFSRNALKDPGVSVLLIGKGKGKIHSRTDHEGT